MKPSEPNYHEPGLIIRGTDSLYQVQKNGSWLKFAELRKGKWKLLRMNQALLDMALQQMKDTDDFRKRMDQERPLARFLANLPGDVIHQEDFIRLTDEERQQFMGMPAMSEDEKEQMRQAMPLTINKVEVQRSIYALYQQEEQARRAAEAAKPKGTLEEGQSSGELEVVAVEEPQQEETKEVA